MSDVNSAKVSSAVKYPMINTLKLYWNYDELSASNS